MAWKMMQEGRDRGKSGYGERSHHMKKKLKEMAEEFINEICDEMEDMDGYGEREDYDPEYERYGERRGVRGTGRYSRVRHY